MLLDPPPYAALGQLPAVPGQGSHHLQLEPVVVPEGVLVVPGHVSQDGQGELGGSCIAVSSLQAVRRVAPQVQAHRQGSRDPILNHGDLDVSTFRVAMSDAHIYLIRHCPNILSTSLAKGVRAAPDQPWPPAKSELHMSKEYHLQRPSYADSGRVSHRTETSRKPLGAPANGPRCRRCLTSRRPDTSMAHYRREPGLRASAVRTRARLEGGETWPETQCR